MESRKLTPVSKPGDCSDAGSTATAVPAAKSEKAIADSILTRRRRMNPSILLLIEKGRARALSVQDRNKINEVSCLLIRKH